jgi:hypothetical protein
MRPVLVSDYPAAHPHVCSKCGVNYDRDWYVDLGVENEWYGVIYFCNLCFTNLVDNVPGYLTETAVLHLRLQIAQLEVENQKLVADLEFVNDILPALVTIGEKYAERINPGPSNDYPSGVSEADSERGETGELIKFVDADDFTADELVSEPADSLEFPGISPSDAVLTLD